MADLMRFSFAQKKKMFDFTFIYDVFELKLDLKLIIVLMDYFQVFLD